MAGLVLITAAGLLIWQDLGRKHLEASEPLRSIGFQYELQRMELLRYAPFRDRHEREISRRLEQAMGELSSTDLTVRVSAIQEVHAILGPRKAKMVAKMARDFPQLKKTVEENLKDSDIAISELRSQYAKSVKSYNAGARAPGIGLARMLFGLPDRLPPLKY